MNRKSTLRTALAALVLALTTLLAGCSSPPDAVIEEAIINKHGGLKMKIYTLENYEITNSYTQEINGETYYVYDYAGNVKAYSDEVRMSGFKVNDTISGTVSIVKRGDNWYF